MGSVTDTPEAACSGLAGTDPAAGPQHGCTSCVASHPGQSPQEDKHPVAEKDTERNTLLALRLVIDGTAQAEALYVKLLSVEVSGTHECRDQP